MANHLYTAIGLMSGTSLDGVDAALIKTDGHNVIERLDFATFPYKETLREAVRACFGKMMFDPKQVEHAENLITQAHIDAVKSFGHKADVIGFHGQTLFHDPANALTLQIGDGQRLARETGMNVVYDFRTADVEAGGQGAPLIPLYHRALAQSSGVALPAAILNIGGVSNITYLGAHEDDVVAFDTGPGNAAIDDFMLHHAGRAMDENGNAAMGGTVDETQVGRWLLHPYFVAAAPKSLDRNAFDLTLPDDTAIGDGAATLAAFTADTVAKSFKLLPQKPAVLYVTGGGRKNRFIMARLHEKLGIPVKAVDDLQWNGDAMEAEGFGYLAVRSQLKLPISLPGTTGCPVPMTGGRFVPALAA